MINEPTLCFIRLIDESLTFSVARLEVIGYWVDEGLVTDEDVNSAVPSIFFKHKLFAKQSVE